MLATWGNIIYGCFMLFLTSSNWEDPANHIISFPDSKNHFGGKLARSFSSKTTPDGHDNACDDKMVV